MVTYFLKVQPTPYKARDFSLLASRLGSFGHKYTLSHLQYNRAKMGGAYNAKNNVEYLGQ